MVQISRLGAAKCRALPRGGGGAGMGLLRQGSEASRARRGRRFGILGKRRCSAWTLAFVALVYLSFFGAKLPFLVSQDELVNRESFTEDIVENGFEYIHDDVFEKVNSSSEVDDHHIIAENDSFQSSLGLSKPDLHAYIEWNISHSRTADIFSKIANLYQNRSKLEFARHTKVKARKHHGPCAIRLGESVDNLVEPENYMNFTKFSLTYTSNEEKLFGNNIFKPRFGGHQALEERENSYYARNQTLHCGFVKGPQGHQSTGFDLNEKDKEYMATCTVVVSSCIFGSSDFLRRPASKMIGAYSKKNVCFMMFLDQLTMTKLSSEGQVPDDKGYIGLWKIIIVKNLPYTDMRKTGKVPKFLSQRLFPSARYSIWIDSKMRLQTDPMLILEYFLWRTKSEYAISNHYDRHCVWDEVIQNKRLNKYNHTAIDEQFLFYQSDGLIRFNESDIHAPLPSYVPEGSFIVRAHTPMSNLFSCLWFNEVDRFTSRDQLSFAYTFLKLRRMNPGKPFFLNMFKDCERRALAKLFHHRVEDPHPPPALR